MITRMNYPIITTNPDHDDQNNEQTTEPSIIPPLRKSQNEKPPIHLMDYNCNSVIHRTSYPITNFISHDNLSSLYSSFCLSHSLNKNLPPMQKLHNIRVGLRQRRINLTL
ncbi:hypothetical protein QL285_027978 [Trifolium repens]|nr:hypothetical protein QL285_027978 [Trifolium repens]